MSEGELKGPADIELALRRVGELLEGERREHRIVVIGGAAMNLLGLRDRATTDVDILAFARRDAAGRIRLRPPDEPLPPDLVAAARMVARDLNLAPDWLNAGPASQWRTGLPPGLEDRIRWRRFSGLEVGIVHRRDLVYFKLYAAADDTGISSVHFQDLLALSPSDSELESAAEWIRSQDPTPGFAKVVAEVIGHVRDQFGRAR